MDFLRNISSSLGTLLLWLLANAIIPIGLPAFFLWSVKVLQGEKDVCFLNLFQQLLENGFYVFSSLALACSLLENLKEFNKTVHWVEASLITALILAIGFMFYQVEFVNKNYFIDNFSLFLCVWIALAAVSSEVKFRMIYKNTCKIWK